MHKCETENADMQATNRTRANYVRYEAEKAAWISLHPDATESEYELAIARIACACGV